MERYLKTNLVSGLTQLEAARRLNRDGPNTFSPPRTTSALILLFRELTLGFASIIWLAIIFSLIVYAFERVPQDYIIAIVLAAVVLLTGLYSFSQQRSSGKIFKSFQNMLPPVGIDLTLIRFEILLTLTLINIFITVVAGNNGHT